MIKNITVANKRRLKELQNLMKQPHNIITFIKNPEPIKDGQFNVCLNYPKSDQTQLDFLQHKWKMEDVKLNKPNFKYSR